MHQTACFSKNEPEIIIILALVRN